MGEREVLGISPKKVSKAWEKLSFWEKNQSMRNVCKGVKKEVGNTRIWW